MKIKIKGVNYTVKFVDCIENTRDSEVIGRTYFEDKVILILKDLSSVSTMKALAHELYHAFFYELGLTRLCDDEDLVECLGHNFSDMQECFNTVLSKFKIKKGEKKC